MKYLMSVCAVMCVSSAAMAQHAGDVILTVTHDTITTDNRVYESELGEIIPNETDEPGFDNLPGTFDPDSEIGFRILDALRAWDGDDFDDIAGPTMTVRFSSLNATTPVASGAVVEGFTLAVNDDGEWHEHLIFGLNSPATDGVYLLQLQLFSTDPLLGDSLPFWLVFNQNEDEVTHEAAVEWVQTNLVPEPASAAMLMFSGLIGVAAMRR